MKLSDLAGEPRSPDPEILGLTADSRQVEAGYLFAALSGEKTDGAKYIPSAEEKGAAAILARPGVETRLPLVEDREPRRRLSSMAARFYGEQPDFTIGVTGTNGKTSTALFAAQLWRSLGVQSGSLGTLGAQSAAFSKKGTHTTPEPVELHETLNEFVEAGVTHLAMEVSSHALAQFRADGVDFKVAAFTNITQDHLDYHADFSDYLNAKARLFQELLASDGIAIINADGAGADEIIARAEQKGLRCLTTGRAGRDVRIASIAPTPRGLDVEMEIGEEKEKLSLGLVGAFQAENAALAAGIVVASGFSPAEVMKSLSSLEPVPGRMELADTVGNAAIYVDYAHTPAAVETALQALRPHTSKKLIAIIGAGGDRDKEKRPLMGAAAVKAADLVIVTDDNPRTEDAAAIRRDVLGGAKDAIEIGDRSAGNHQRGFLVGRRGHFVDCG